MNTYHIKTLYKSSVLDDSFYTKFNIMCINLYHSLFSYDKLETNFCFCEINRKLLTNKSSNNE